MRMSEEDGKTLMNALGNMRDLEAELAAIDYDNDPEAQDKQGEIMDLLMTFGMAVAPLRRQLASYGK